MLGGMIQEFRRALVSLGHAHGEFGVFERLDRRHFAPRQGPGAVEIVRRLQRLRPRTLDHGLGAFPARLGGAQSSFRLAAAALIEERRRRGQNRGHDVIDVHGVACLEPDPSQPASQGRRHDIAFADPRLAVLVDGRDEFALGDRRGLDRNRPRRHRPDAEPQTRQDNQRRQDAAEGDLHGQSRVLRTATRSRRSMRRRTV